MARLHGKCGSARGHGAGGKKLNTGTTPPGTGGGAPQLPRRGPRHTTLGLVSSSRRGPGRSGAHRHPVYSVCVQAMRASRRSPRRRSSPSSTRTSTLRHATKHQPSSWKDNISLHYLSRKVKKLSYKYTSLFSCRLILLFCTTKDLDHLNHSSQLASPAD
jgi:hypothetical protein